MQNGEDSAQDSQRRGARRFAPWVTAVFLLFFFSLASAVAFLLVREGRWWVLVLALLFGIVVGVLEKVETQYFTFRVPDWNAITSYLIPATAIGLVTFIVCLPALGAYFLVDDFAFVHAFHNLSAADFLRLLHTDLGRFVWGDTRQEYRPLYGLYYVAGYHIWGLRPWGYHLAGILLHCLVSFLVFLIAKSLAPGEPYRAGFAGLLFAVQPPHAQALSLMVGFVAESLPAFFYLTAFLCFIRFRSSGQLRYLGISTLAFAGCLLTKESAVTLPILLVSYDLYRAVVGEERLSSRERQSAGKAWRELALPYVGFGTLLLAYLEWRRTVFTSYLRETGWGSHAQGAVASPLGFWVHIHHLVTRFWNLQVFNFQNLILSYPSVALVFGLGLCLAWAFSLARRRSECSRSLALIIYFGLAWYLVSNLPYLIEGQVIYHLYLPASGACIALAFLAIPSCQESGHGAGYARVLGLLLLAGFSATQLWKDNREYGRMGDWSARMAGQLALAARSIPDQGLVIIRPAESRLIASGWGEEILPFALQPPFTPTDLVSRIRVIEHPDMSCCGVAEWWEKVRPLLSDELGRAPDQQVEIHLLSWDERSQTFQQRTRILPRRLLVACVTKALGGPAESVDSLEEAGAIGLVEALARLAYGGNIVPEPQ